MRVCIKRMFKDLFNILFIVHENINVNVLCVRMFVCVMYKKHLMLQLSRACAFEIRRVMRQRAIRVELEPRIEEPCMADLGAFCSERVEEGDVSTI